MKPDIDPRPLNQIRRQDRAVSDEGWIKKFLRRAPFGVLATANERQPFVNTNLFAYDEAAHVIYMHTATEGRTPDNVRANPLVCFTVAEIGRLLPAERARGFSVEYASVVVFGHARLLDDDVEMIHGLQLLLDKYFPLLRPGEHYPPLDSDELEGTAVLRIDVQSWSGKHKQADPGFPGAFTYGEPE